jgi:hypothetical protein
LISIIQVGAMVAFLPRSSRAYFFLANDNVGSGATLKWACRRPRADRPLSRGEYAEPSCTPLAILWPLSWVDSASSCTIRIFCITFAATKTFCLETQPITTTISARQSERSCSLQFKYPDEPCWIFLRLRIAHQVLHLPLVISRRALFYRWSYPFLTLMYTATMTMSRIVPASGPALPGVSKRTLRRMTRWPRPRTSPTSVATNLVASLPCAVCTVCGEKRPLRPRRQVCFRLECALEQAGVPTSGMIESTGLPPAAS